MKKIYLTSRIFIVLLGILMCVNTASAQAGKKVIASMNGVVVDEYNNAIAGAVVDVEGRDISALSDPDGSFNIVGNYFPDDKFTASAVGYATIQVERGTGDKLIITMVRDAARKNQIVNGINDSRESYTVTSSTSTISGDELRSTHHLNLGAALAGRLPGLIVRTGGNEPGSESFTLNIRGTSTMNARNPLVLVDGMIASISDVNPNDVESVSVLKDAAAAGLYGMKGANGIVSIVTKRGESGTPKVSVDYNFTMQQQSKLPQMMTSLEYAELQNEAYSNDGYGDYYKFSRAQIEMYRTNENPESYPSVDYYDLNMKDFVSTHNAQVNAFGGGEYVKYNVNVGYVNQDSQFNFAEPEGDFGIHRINIRSRVDAKLNDWIRVYANLAVRTNRERTTATAEGTIYSSLFGYEPTIGGPLTPEGNIVADINNQAPAYAKINRDGYKKQTQSYMTSISGVNFNLDFITQGLSAAADFAFYSDGASTIAGNKTYAIYVRDEMHTDELVYMPYGTAVDSSTKLTKSRRSSFGSDIKFNINYDRHFGDHGLRVNLSSDKFYDNLYQATAVPFPVARMTFGGALSYSYKDFLFVDAIASYQGSEMFSPENRWGLFPSVSAAWVASNNDFLKDNDVITYLKLRGSYGRTGSDTVSNDRYSYRDRFTFGGGAFVGYYGNAIKETTYGNPVLTWEKSNYANVGLEMSFLNQITLGVEYFHDIRTDILITDNFLPLIGGIATGNLPKTNSGQITNQGVDVQLGYIKDLNKNWTVGANAHFSFNQNVIDEINEIPNSDEYAQIYNQKGSMVGQCTGYKVDYSNGNGFYNTQAEIDESGLTYSNGTPRVGDLILQDLSGDGVIDAKDIVNIGNTTIPQISWGAELFAEWKGLDVSVLLQGIGKWTTMYNGCGYFETYSNGTYYTLQKSAWTAERYAAGEEITAPALSTVGSTSLCNNDYFLEDRSFFRIKNIELGYTLPESVSKAVSCQQVRFYLSGANLFTFDNMRNPDLDPESSSMTAFSVNKYLTAGLNITF